MQIILVCLQSFLNTGHSKSLMLALTWTSPHSFSMPHLRTFYYSDSSSIVYSLKQRGLNDRRPTLVFFLALTNPLQSFGYASSHRRYSVIESCKVGAKQCRGGWGRRGKKNILAPLVVSNFHHISSLPLFERLH
jgi:hypothetical protein